MPATTAPTMKTITIPDPAAELRESTVASITRGMNSFGSTYVPNLVLEARLEAAYRALFAIAELEGKAAHIAEDELASQKRLNRPTTTPA